MIAGCGSQSKDLSVDHLAGRWKCELYGSELVIEFTDDGRFISHTDMSENCYRIEDGMIVTFVENILGSDVKVEAKVKDNILIFGGVEYIRFDH